ncbi:unnamed protein product, partial [Amoebophrya sp. A120]
EKKNVHERKIAPPEQPVGRSSDAAPTAAASREAPRITAPPVPAARIFIHSEQAASLAQAGRSCQRQTDSVKMQQARRNASRSKKSMSRRRNHVLDQSAQIIVESARLAAREALTNDVSPAAGEPALLPTFSSAAPKTVAASQVVQQPKPLVV